MTTAVGIIGAGTMGAGIAQVAAAAGWDVHLLDVDDATAQRAIEGVRGRLDRLVEKGRLEPAARDAAAARLHVAGGPEDLRACGLLIEAVFEDLDAKKSVLQRAMAALPADAIIATNTSSLSVGALGEAIGAPERTVGMHFFNPAPLMKLVEVIAGAHTDAAVVDRTAAIAESWGKIVARAADVPGFIVNHVARPYYLEAFRILEDGYAAPDEIDGAMKALAGFRMGPLELTDLIGQDVNTATTRSVWEQLDRPPLLAPSRLQEQLVAEGHLGRKTKRGVYDYATDPPAVALQIERRPLPSSPAAAVDAWCAAVGLEGGSETDRYVVARIIAGLIVQATLAEARGVATQRDIDTALKYGTNYPRGPFEWAAVAGRQRCTALLEALGESAGDRRFTPPVARPSRA